MDASPKIIIQTAARAFEVAVSQRNRYFVAIKIKAGATNSTPVDLVDLGVDESTIGEWESEPGGKSPRTPTFEALTAATRNLSTARDAIYRQFTTNNEWGRIMPGENAPGLAEEYKKLEEELVPAELEKIIEAHPAALEQWRNEKMSKLLKSAAKAKHRSENLSDFDLQNIEKRLNEYEANFPTIGKISRNFGVSLMILELPSGIDDLESEREAAQKQAETQELRAKTQRAKADEDEAVAAQATAQAVQVAAEESERQSRAKTEAEIAAVRFLFKKQEEKMAEAIEQTVISKKNELTELMLEMLQQIRSKAYYQRKMPDDFAKRLSGIVETGRIISEIDSDFAKILDQYQTFNASASSSDKLAELNELIEEIKTQISIPKQDDAELEQALLTSELEQIATGAILGEPAEKILAKASMREALLAVRQNDLQQKRIDAANAIRARQGLSPLEESDRLEVSATVSSTYDAEAGF